MTLEHKISNAKVAIVLGDITDQDVDAIVNAANPSLMGGGGVDGAIHRKGGPRIAEECRRIREKRWPGGLPTGEAVITSGGNLKARHVIHTVGPIWRGGDSGEPDLLTRAYQNSLRLAASRGLRTIAFPSISTGAYGYPVEEAAPIAVRAVKEFLGGNETLSEVALVLFTGSDLEKYAKAAEEILGTPLDSP
ncbi:MAG: O-acetyl-ADP-ribose deacetylase [Candidatus Bathyarchaeota archaeon]|nr:O-acetyl-ADP-ribose deacetylase [Candidatus Bathyarchaeota archaeon]